MHDGVSTRQPQKATKQIDPVCKLVALVHLSYTQIFVSFFSSLLS